VDLTSLIRCSPTSLMGFSSSSCSQVSNLVTEACHTVTDTAERRSDMKPANGSFNEVLNLSSKL
jgi:hypothetical protein